MVTMAGKEIFIDTNVLIYLNNTQHPFHKDVLHTLTLMQDEAHRFIINDQIIKEFLVVKSNLLNLENRFDTSVLEADVDFITESFIVLQNPATILKRLIALISKYHLKGKVIHDAFIAAFCLESGINQILTVNVKDFAVFYDEGIEIVALTKAKENE